jgi:hypothetical protein
MASPSPAIDALERPMSSRLPRRRVGSLGSLEVGVRDKVLIFLYIWQGCQGCQIFSLAALPTELAALNGRRRRSHQALPGLARRLRGPQPVHPLSQYARIDAAELCGAAGPFGDSLDDWGASA